jgi:hypothetical protein
MFLDHQWQVDEVVGQSYTIDEISVKKRWYLEIFMAMEHAYLKCVKQSI